ncbi:MAG: recombinase family protein, partial [Patescibacteria group bacterium]
LMILCSQAKLENDNKSVNVKRGLKTRCEMGLRPGVAPTGYLNEKRSDRKCHSIVDPERAHIVKQIFEKFVHEHWSGRKIYHWLKFDLKFRTRSNHHLSLSNLYLILQNPFYCGIFEFPVKSGNWYTGKHEPLITKELYDLVQQQLKRNHVVRSEMKEFAFTRLISCGICNSSITAEEKYKKLSDGTTARYVYYGCTRNKDARCGNLYIREEELVKQLVGIIDQLDINEIGLKHKFEKEVEQLKDLQESFFGGSDLVMNRKIDLREYAKHVLRKGGIGEKRELLGCLKSRLLLKDKNITCEK